MTANADQWTNRIEIKSSSSSRVYVVAQRVSTGLWECSCPGWKARRRCKHLASMNLATTRPIEPAPKGCGAGDSFTFTDAAYRHYDTRQGFGSPSEWFRLAEERARGRGRYHGTGYRRERTSTRADDMKLLGLTEMPADAHGLLKAMRRRAKVTHPDCGGTAEAFREMFAAYERLLRMY